MKKTVAALVWMGILVSAMMTSAVHADTAGSVGREMALTDESGAGGLKSSAQPVDPARHGEIKARLAAVRVPFIKNEGQAGAGSVKYYARTMSGTVLVEDDSLAYALPGAGGKGCVIREKLVKPKGTTVEGLSPSKTKVSYFKGRDKNQWKKNLPTYDIVGFGEVYEKVKLDVRAYNNNVEKVFTVEPGGEPNNISVKMELTSM